MDGNIKGLVSAGHEMASELKAECGAVDMRGVAKLISDLATQLEVQLVRANALAAENAKLKKFCKDAAFDADYEAELGMERGGFSDALNEIKTPATDAFLAEVRAQGVELLREHPAIQICSLTHVCDEFAAQLRQGEAV
ncbi:hypothetical protein OkiPb01091_18960 [Escherichia coli]|nr:hypothetical protein [Escherichia coli]EIB8540523.1 hypothetical protein [Escherichia coli]EKO0588949.1 hypothetical protein [Escherichia coli]HBQ4524667.1 hypothetical protein [Escherichia coli]